MNEIIIALGTNQGDRRGQLNSALGMISQEIGSVMRVSPVIESEPWGYASAYRYLNQVIGVNTLLTPEEALIKLQKIEKELGRIPSSQYTDRPMDLDILDVIGRAWEDDPLLHGGRQMLRIPHERTHERLFVLLPLIKIYPEYVHPILGKSVGQMIEACTDEGDVRWI